MTYDPNDNLLSLTDPVGNETSFEYDKLDRKTSMTDPRMLTAYYAYDADSRMISETDRAGRDREYIYDGNGNKTGEVWTVPDLGTCPYPWLVGDRSMQRAHMAKEECH